MALVGDQNCTQTCARRVVGWGVGDGGVGV